MISVMRGPTAPLIWWSSSPAIAAPAVAVASPVDLDDLALPYCQYTRRVQQRAVRLVAEDGLPYQAASWHLWRDHRVFVPYATIQNWVEAAGEKKGGQPLDHLPQRGAG
jgi:hypothetical protein